MIYNINEKLNSLTGKIMFNRLLILSYDFDDINNKLILNVKDIVTNHIYDYTINNFLNDDTKEAYILPRSYIRNIEDKVPFCFFSLTCIEPIIITHYDQYRKLIYGSHLGIVSQEFNYVKFSKNKRFKNDANHFRII